MLDGKDEEVQFTTEGAVCGIDLPPFHTIPRNRAHILQQSIQVTGLDGGKGLFSDGLRTIREAQLVLSRAATGLGEWQPGECKQHRDSPSLDIGNRIFEAKTSSGADVPFDDSVDPKGVLALLARQSGLRHTVDNAVLYLKRRMVGGKFKHNSISPQTIKIGDLVEVKFSIIAVPAKFASAGGPLPSGMSCRIKLKLRAIVLLDTEFSDNEIRVGWERERSAKRAVEDPEEDGRAAVVRRNGYVDEDSE
ncbi:hypothetical protein CYLTODRAFT_137724 [Cylindrobasidium torrendii FP15055 ss-10]|nr:hypothetical protein CYLTODRAFT_167051 [Cylindrobasidium torrendii FP15055 ss-10]KIY63405.1 hypothetical protein CYLTODRAFT_137724 [Cylindrobasidium torrendii FP15055 ss-10]